MPHQGFTQAGGVILTTGKIRKVPKILPASQRFGFLIALCDRELRKAGAGNGQDVLARSYNLIMKDAKEIQSRLERERRLTFGYTFAHETTAGPWDDELLHDLKSLYPTDRMKNKPVALARGHSHHVHTSDRGKRFLEFMASKDSSEAETHAAVMAIMDKVLKPSP